MPDQEQPRNGKPQKDKDRPSPDVERSAGRATGSAPETEEPSHQDYRGDGPAKIGLLSDDQPGLVAPSGVNQRDHGAADDPPQAGGTLNFDDGTDMVHPRGKVTSASRTSNETNPSDAGELGPPQAGLSDRNGPSDPDAKRSR
jgi:hypothetical protein